MLFSKGTIFTSIILVGLWILLGVSAFFVFTKNNLDLDWVTVSDNLKPAYFIMISALIASASVLHNIANTLAQKNIDKEKARITELRYIYFNLVKANNVFETFFEGLGGDNPEYSNTAIKNILCSLDDYVSKFDKKELFYYLPKDDVEYIMKIIVCLKSLENEIETNFSKNTQNIQTINLSKDYAKLLPTIQNFIEKYKDEFGE